VAGFLTTSIFAFFAMIILILLYLKWRKDLASPPGIAEKDEESEQTDRLPLQQESS
jgi:hypothetical protein